MHGDRLFKTVKLIPYLDIDFICSLVIWFLISQCVDSLTSYQRKRRVDIVRIHVVLFWQAAFIHWRHNWLIRGKS